MVSPLRGEWIEIDAITSQIYAHVSRLSEASGLKSPKSRSSARTLGLASQRRVD